MKLSVKFYSIVNLAKFNSTYIEGLLKEIHEDGKIHTRFQQALTTTGRLSSINPNLQNIPVRLEEGRKIRAAFVPSEPDWLLFAADYSQIELRVLAHMSQDEKLIEAFHQGEDIHTKTAADVFGVAIDEVTFFECEMLPKQSTLELYTALAIMDFRRT